MVNLTESQALNFLAGLPPMAFLLDVPPATQTVGTILTTRKNASGRNVHSTSGAKAYTYTGTKVDTLPNAFSIVLPSSVISRNFRFTCGNNWGVTFPTPPVFCASLAAVSITLNQTHSFVFPSTMSAAELNEYLVNVSKNPNFINTRRKPDIHPIHLNDFSESKLAY